MTRAIGVISGTSMDGIDVAMLDGDGETITAVGPGAAYPYPAEVVVRLREIVADPELAARHGIEPRPILLKIAPDLSEPQLAAIVEMTREVPIRSRRTGL